MARTDRQPRQRLSVEERRKLILEAAAKAFATAPYPDVSVSRIAAECGASEALVHRYFDGKAGLYAEVIQTSIDDLRERQRLADKQLGAGVSARDRVQMSLIVYLDYIVEAPTGWAAQFITPGNDPEPAHRVRREARRAYVDMLREVLQPTGGVRHDYALEGYFGFLDAACLAWVEHGCPIDERWPLIDAALGSLEGALGDWGR